MKALWLLSAVALFSQALPTAACTGIRLRPQDGSVVCARTLEFGTDLRSSIIIIPRGKELVGTAPEGRRGIPWVTRFGTVGTNAFGLPAIVDGVNERGLSVGIFYFPGYAAYQASATEEAGKTLAPWELATFLLGTTATVDEAVAASRAVRVGEVVQKDFGFVPPCHYVLHDATGRCAVLEYVAGQLHVHDNPLGVMTNSPTFDWHITNLRNYASLSVTNAPPVEMQGIKLSGFGQGNGLLGLPGDFTPPARFVRAVAFSQSAVPVQTSRDGVLAAFHILNQFDIPRGSVRDVDHGREHDEYTLWTSAADLTTKRYYFHTFASRRIRMVDLARVDLDAADVKTISMAGEEEISDVSGQAK